MSKEQSFAERMIKTYPAIFPEKGPQCGLSCPPGWENIVKTLCSSINSYVTSPQSVQTKKSKVLQSIYRKIFVPPYNVLYRLIDPSEKLHWENGKRKQYIWHSKAVADRIELENPVRTKLLKLIQKVSSKLSPVYKWNKVPRKPVQVQQVKEKFAALRFYYDGGDPYVAGLVSMAESLSERTCQETGNPGRVYTNKGWHVTLCDEKAKQLGYK